MTLHFQNKDIKSLRISELKLVNNSGTIYYLFKKKKRNGKKNISKDYSKNYTATSYMLNLINYRPTYRFSLNLIV